MDVKKTFLYGDLEKKSYIRQPKGFIIVTNPLTYWLSKLEKITRFTYLKNSNFKS